MKKILLAIIAVIFTFGAYAQTDSTNRKWSQSEDRSQSKDRSQSGDRNYSDSENQNHPDGFMYQNGEMLMVKNQKVTRVEKDMTLSNGTVISSDGNYTKKGGTKVRFKEGEHMDMSGKIVQGNHSKDIDRSGKSDKNKDMHLLRDSKKNDPK